MRSSFNFQSINDPAAPVFTLRYLTDPSLVAFSDAGSDRHREPPNLPALLAPAMEKTLNFTDGLVASPICRLGEKPAIFLAHFEPGWLEVMKDPAINYIISRLKILTATDVNRSERSNHQWHDVQKTIHAETSFARGTTGA
jgi:hypothetical protein